MMVTMIAASDNMTAGIPFFCWPGKLTTSCGTQHWQNKEIIPSTSLWILPWRSRKYGALPSSSVKLSGEGGRLRTILLLYIIYTS